MKKIITQTGFDKLLATLDADREAAGAKYESLRRRLIKFFEWRNCETAEELTDTVFDRVIKKIAEGEEIQNVGAYSATVAQFFLKKIAGGASVIFSQSRTHRKLKIRRQNRKKTMTGASIGIWNLVFNVETSKKRTGNCPSNFSVSDCSIVADNRADDNRNSKAKKISPSTPTARQVFPTVIIMRQTRTKICRTKIKTRIRRRKLQFVRPCLRCLRATFAAKAKCPN